MPGKAVGRAAVELPWLCPNTDSLIALADAPATVAGVSATDPALSIFLLRFAQASADPNSFEFAPGALLSAFLPDTAAAYLAATTAGVLPTGSFVLTRVRGVAERAGAIAARLAELTRFAPADAAATVARLAPLGWYALATVNVFDGGDPLHDPEFAERPAEIQTEVWGLDHAAITRRLAARWRLPNWVSTTLGCLTLPLGVAGPLVSHPHLFAVVQLAVFEAEGQGSRLGLTHGANRDELLAHLRLSARAVDALLARLPEGCPAPAGSGFSPNPHAVPLVRNLLRMAAESRRRNGPALIARLEEEIDQLHRVAAELGDQAGDRLHRAKLAGLAELAAGAAHEINNPLAIISGNAQRLLRTEPDPDRGESLQAIIRQSQRIAGILRDLMQFARPPRPEIRAFPVSELVDGACKDLSHFATERGVRLEFDTLPPGAWIEGDVKQLRHALGAVVRNAIEAAGADGWVRVSCAGGDGDVALIVEDSGPGLTAEVAEHAFDPFYCGRSAGRGRGLGLPTAWQLVRQNGGDLHFDTSADGPTRFRLTTRRAVGQELFSLRSA